MSQSSSHHRVLMIAMAFGFAITGAASTRAESFNIGAGFSATTNPVPGGLWRYGWSASLTSPMNLYDQPGTIGPLQSWNDSALGSLPNLAYNPTNQLQGTWPPSTVGLQPGPDGQYSRVRFTAPQTNIYYIALEFTALDAATADVHVILNNALPTLFSGELSKGSGGPLEFFPQGMILAAGDTIDFVVGYGPNGDNTADTTAVFTTIQSGCLADVATDNRVNVDDLLQLINSWGPCDFKVPGCPDLAPNGSVDVDDLLVVINGWGPCN